MDAHSSRPLRVVICPWLAFGHLLPCLDLAERLASRGHRVSYVSTPRNIALLPPLRPAAAPRVDLVALPLPRVDGLPDGAESTNDVPYDKNELLLEAFDGLAPAFAEFLRASCADDGKRPDWVIVNSYSHWTAAVALEHKVPCAALLVCAANLVVVCARQSSAPERAEPTAGEQPAIVEERQAAAEARYEAEQKIQLLNMHATASGTTMTAAQRSSLTLLRCSLVFIRSCVEWEPESVPLLATLGSKPVLPLGLLPPSPDGGGGRGAGVDGGEDAAVRWLDAQPAGSVVYVALGSEVPLRAQLLHELALGLELAGARFLWALRKPAGVPDADVLPDGFEERTRGRGLLVTGWAPQIRILAHDAVGAFLTHCGWGSIIEGLMFGRPLIMLPIYADQGATAGLMEGKKVGMRVPRYEKDGSFDREGVARTVRVVMLEEETRSVFVGNAKKLQEIVVDRERHESYIDGFVMKLRTCKG